MIRTELVLKVTHHLPAIEKAVLFHIVAHAVRLIDHVLLCNPGPAGSLIFLLPVKRPLGLRPLGCKDVHLLLHRFAELQVRLLLCPHMQVNKGGAPHCRCTDQGKQQQPYAFFARVHHLLKPPHDLSFLAKIGGERNCPPPAELDKV